MSFSGQSWENRFGILGDIAEGVFEEVAPLGTSLRYGFNRPPFSLARTPDFIKHTPDYVTGTGHLVEVMGCGRDGIVKLKLVKWGALRTWNRVTGDNDIVVLFLWNSRTSEWSLVQWDELQQLVTQARRAGVKAFDDGNEYLAIPWVSLDRVTPYDR